MSATTILQLGTGLMSTFGGPADMDVGPQEGLALINDTDLNNWAFASLFLDKETVGNVGLGRQLNPRAFYCAMRWDEVLKPHNLFYFTPQRTRNLVVTTLLRHCLVRLSNPRNDIVLFARPVDYGPGDGKVVDGQQDPDTHRLVDMSPGAAATLGLLTDQVVRAELILPEVES